MNKVKFFGQTINVITRGDETCFRFKHYFHYLFDLHFPVLFVSQQCKQKPWERADAPLSGTFVMVTRQLPGGQGYVARCYPAWDNFPSDDLHAVL